MVTFALDASALLRFVDNEAGSHRVAEILSAKATGSAEVIMSAIHWGEVVGVLHRRHGSDAVIAVLHGIQSLPVTMIPATAERAANSAELSFRYKIPYADSFGLDLASDSSEHCFVTADFDLLPAATDFRIEFLPAKTQPSLIPKPKP